MSVTQQVGPSSVQWVPDKWLIYSTCVWPLACVWLLNAWLHMVMLHWPSCLFVCLHGHTAWAYITGLNRRSAFIGYIWLKVCWLTAADCLPWKLIVREEFSNSSWHIRTAGSYSKACHHRSHAWLLSCNVSVLTQSSCLTSHLLALYVSLPWMVLNKNLPVKLGTNNCLWGSFHPNLVYKWLILFYVS